MKIAVIVFVPMSTAKGFAWRWRAADHKQESTQSFHFYYECVADVERSGYKVELGRMEAISAFGQRHEARLVPAPGRLISTRPLQRTEEL